MSTKQMFNFDSNTVVATTTGGAMLGASLGNVPGFLIGTVIGVLAGAYSETKPKNRSTKPQKPVSVNS